MHGRAYTSCSVPVMGEQGRLSEKVTCQKHEPEQIFGCVRLPCAGATGVRLPQLTPTQGPTYVGTRGPDAQGGAQGNFCERVATKTHSSSPAVHFKDLGGRQSNFCEDTARHHSHYLSWQPTISLPSVSIGREESYCESIHFRRSQSFTCHPSRYEKWTPSELL